MFSKALRPCLEKTERTLHQMSHSGFASVDGLDNPKDILDRAGTAWKTVRRSLPST
jgi:hypothetical protein